MHTIKQNKLLIAFFFLAIFVRFLFFPGNTHFAFDQARDAYASQEILKGDLKLIGPSSTFLPGLRHGVLFYYIAAPVYLISAGNPEGLSIFLRIANALGVFGIFFLSLYLFNKKTALISAFIFAISFEQTQYALFLGHPPLAIIPLLLFYYGLAIYFIKKNIVGMILTAIGLGIAIQFHIGLAFLLPLPFLLLAIFYKDLPKTTLKIIVISIITFLLSISTFILEAIKNNFRVYKNISGETFSDGGITTLMNKIEGLDFTINRFFNDNFFYQPLPLLTLVIVPVMFLIGLKFKQHRKSMIFLIVWFLYGLIPYALRSSVIYYYSIGTSISLIILVAFLLSNLKNKMISLLIIVLAFITISNGYLIIKNNPLGPIIAITSQNGMLLKDQKALIDYTYQKANFQPFAVNSLSVPFHVNTTWSYVYNYYGLKKYGYLPVWGGDHAAGFYTNLEVNTNRSSLPYTRFLIIEQTQGLRKDQIDKFIEEEYIFTEKVEEKRFGLLELHSQKAK